MEEGKKNLLMRVGRSSSTSMTRNSTQRNNGLSCDGENINGVKEREKRERQDDEAGP